MSGCRLLSTGSWKCGCSKARGVPWYSFSLKAKRTRSRQGTYPEAHLHLPQALLNSKKPPSCSVPAVKPLSFQARPGIAQTHRCSPAVKNSRFLCAGFVSATPGPHFLLCAHRQPNSQRAPSSNSGETYVLSSTARSVASGLLLKSGMSPKPQERCREHPSSFAAITTTSTTTAMPGWFREVWK